MSFAPDILLTRLEELERVAGRPARLIVALSGGLDSTVLLHALATSRKAHKLPLLAAHIDHQLHGSSSDWSKTCADQAAELGVEFLCEQVTVDPAAGTGPEAAARDARYAAMARIVGAADWLLSAHHLDDQAETLLLNLMRGSGPSGIAGIAAARPFSKGWLIRPLLSFAREELKTYADTQDLSWLDDPSNDSDRFDRNYLRHTVLPALESRWPQAGKRIVRSADLARDAADLLAELAAIDLAAVCSEPGRIDIDGLGQLSEQRQRNLLRHAIQGLGLPMPAAAQLQSILDDLLPARKDAEPLVRWPGVEVRRYRNHLYLLEETGDSGHGELELVEGADSGLSDEVVEAGLELRYRRGGEEFQPAGQSHTKKLKKLLQEEGIVPWMRERLPLLYSDGRLVAVADIWLAADAVSQPGTAIRWKGRPALH